MHGRCTDVTRSCGRGDDKPNLFISGFAGGWKALPARGRRAVLHPYRVWLLRRALGCAERSITVSMIWQIRSDSTFRLLAFENPHRHSARGDGRCGSSPGVDPYVQTTGFLTKISKARLFLRRRNQRHQSSKTIKNYTVYRGGSRNGGVVQGRVLCVYFVKTRASRWVKSVTGVR